MKIVFNLTNLEIRDIITTYIFMMRRKKCEV